MPDRKGLYRKYLNKVIDTPTDFCYDAGILLHLVK
jgi:hypothetical protein